MVHRAQIGWSYRGRPRTGLISITRTWSVRQGITKHVGVLIHTRGCGICRLSLRPETLPEHSRILGKSSFPAYIDLAVGYVDFSQQPWILSTFLGQPSPTDMSIHPSRVLAFISTLLVAAT